MAEFSGKNSGCLALGLPLWVMMPSTDQSESTKTYANIYEFKTLLLVDDDRQLVETLQWILASENFLVEVAHNGNEAMAKISANHYDAVNPPVLAWRSNILSASRTAESACQIDDNAYQQNQPEPAATDGGATKVKSATAEQEK